MAKQAKAEASERRTKKRSILTAGILGAAVAYFLDPERGRARRVKARDRLAATARRLQSRGDRLARRAESQVYGVWQRTTHTAPQDPTVEGETLKDKVETEIFGRPDVQKGKIVVNVEDGIVVLRGEVASTEQMNELARLAIQTPGAEGVQNLLHLPQEEPPNKAAAREASATAVESE